MVDCLKDDYNVKAATRGQRALRIARSGEPPDMILLDIMMPEMDGFEVCEQLKADLTTRHIPVIFITAKIGIEDEIKGLELGAVDYIAKPISPRSCRRGPAPSWHCMIRTAFSTARCASRPPSCTRPGSRSSGGSGGRPNTRTTRPAYM
nr:response regulator [Halochromatium glycolicum]